MNIDGLFEMDIDIVESAIALETINTKECRKLKVYVPKLMSNMEIDTCKDKTQYISRQLLANDPSTIPNFNYRIETCNYITVNIPNSIPDDVIINKGDHIYLLFPNKNIRDMKFMLV